MPALGEFTPQQLSGMVGLPPDEFWHAKEIFMGGQKYKVIDTGQGTRRLEPVQERTRTAEDFIREQQDRLKEMVRFRQELFQSTPLSFDEMLSRQMAEQKFKPYYQEVLEDFVKPIETRIQRSTSDQTRVLGELVRREELGGRQIKRETEMALERARGGYAGAGLLGSGIEKRGAALGEIAGTEKLGDFMSRSRYAQEATRLEEERKREDFQRDIAQQQRDIFGKGRQFETAVTGEVESQKGLAERQRLSRIQEALGSRYPEFDQQNQSYLKLA